MSLGLAALAANIENTDEFHLARLLILLRASAKRSDKPVNGIMKLAKLDFLLRYPSCLQRALVALGRTSAAEAIPQDERNTIEARMIRFRFGPWDKRYRRWLGLLVAKGLAQTYLDGKTVNIKLTETGKQLAEELRKLPEFESLANRSALIATALGDFGGSKLKRFIYQVFPEIVDMRWGRSIEL
jgi:hypothetical protein